MGPCKSRGPSSVYVYRGAHLGQTACLEHCRAITGAQWRATEGRGHAKVGTWQLKGRQRQALFLQCLPLLSRPWRDNMSFHWQEGFSLNKEIPFNPKVHKHWDSEPQKAMQPLLQLQFPFSFLKKIYFFILETENLKHTPHWAWSPTQGLTQGSIPPPRDHNLSQDQEWDA